MRISYLCVLICLFCLNCGDDGGGEGSSLSTLSMDSSTSTGGTEEESDGSQGETVGTFEEWVQFEITLLCPQCRGSLYWFIFYIEGIDEGEVCGVFSGDDALYCEEGRINCSLEYMPAEADRVHYTRAFVMQEAPAVNLIKLLVVADTDGDLLLDPSEYFVDLFVPLFQDTSIFVEPDLQGGECRGEGGGDSENSTGGSIETAEPSTGGQESEDASSLETALSTESTTGGESAEESTAQTSFFTCEEDEFLVVVTINLLPQDDNVQLASEFGAGWCDPEGCEERRSGVGRVEVFRGCVRSDACREGIQEDKCEWTANLDNGAYWLLDWIDANVNRVLDEGECRLRHQEHDPQFLVDGNPVQCTFGQNRDPCLPETCGCNVVCPFSNVYMNSKVGE